MPTLYTSLLRGGHRPARAAGGLGDALVVGFREQTAAVAVGINALIDRAAVEGTSIIIEGAHVVPGFFDAEARNERILAVPVVITVEDEDMHRSHFVARGNDVTLAPAQRYADRVREHPAAAAVHEEPGAVPRRADHPQLQLRPGARRGDRPGHGEGHGTGGAGTAPSTDAVQEGRTA